MALAKLLFGLTARKMGTEKLYRVVANARRKELSDILTTRFSHTVIDGPFKGMKLPGDSSWGDGDILPKLIGAYEANLHVLIDKAVARKPDVIVNVGCAEGYYAIGLGRLLPDAIVHAYDIDGQAQRVCRETAKQNGLGDGFHVHGLCTADELEKILTDAKWPLIVMDCEGAEMQLLDPVKAPALAHCDIIVETHDFVVPNIAATIEERFNGSHDIERQSHGGRNPNIAALAAITEIERWLMVNENRPGIMEWLACWARR